MVKSKLKLYKCKVDGCNKQEPILSKGMCKYHYMQERNKKVEPIKLEKDKELTKFFNKQKSLLAAMPLSEHSGCRIRGVSSKNIAHILPKRYFKSVAANSLNVLWLTWGEHSFFDNLLDKFDFRRLEQEFELGWDIAVSRLKQLLPLIPKEEQNTYYKKLKTYIDSRYGSKI